MLRFCSSLLACALMIPLVGCCCGAGSSEAKATAKAEEVFAAIRANDVEGLRATFNPWMAEHYGATRVSDILDAHPTLRDHDWVGLTPTVCSKYSCDFDCTLEPGTVPCWIQVFEGGNGWELQELAVNGEVVLP